MGKDLRYIYIYIYIYSIYIYGICPTGYNRAFYGDMLPTGYDMTGCVPKCRIQLGFKWQ